MSDDNKDFACPFSGEPLDLCGCEEAHGPAGPKDGASATLAVASGTGSGTSTRSLSAATPSSSAASSDAPITPCEVIDPKAAAPSAGDTAITSSEPPATLRPAAADAKPARRHTKAQERDLEVVKRADRKVRLANVRTMMMIHRAPEIDPDGPKPEDWTDKEFRIARAAWKSTRECPSFITIAEKTYSTLVRAEAMREHDPSPQLNCDIQVFVNQQNIYNYETVEGDEQK